MTSSSYDHFFWIPEVVAYESVNCTQVFLERGKLEYSEKNLSEQGENQQTQPTYDAGSGNQTRATLVGGKRSHHCATLASLVLL